jgi:hypothetical protein
MTDARSAVSYGPAHMVACCREMAHAGLLASGLPGVAEGQRRIVTGDGPGAAWRSPRPALLAERSGDRVMVAAGRRWAFASAPSAADCC